MPSLIALEPGRCHRAPSERRDRRRHRRRGRRAAGAGLVCGAPARLCRSRADGTVQPLPGPSCGADQRGCPPARRSIRTHAMPWEQASHCRRRTGTAHVMRENEAAPAVSVVVPVRNEAGQHRAAGGRDRSGAGRTRRSRSSMSTMARPTAPKPSCEPEGVAAVAAPDQARARPAGNRRRCAPASRMRARRSS